MVEKMMSGDQSGQTSVCCEHVELIFPCEDATSIAEETTASAQKKRGNKMLIDALNGQIAFFMFAKEHTQLF